jgi:P-type conjugative transfer protein TrbJ
MRRLIISLLVAVLMASPHPSFGGGRALEVTQLMNHVELVTQVSQLAEQIRNQLEMLENMYTNTVNIKNPVWGAIESELAQLAAIVKQGQALAYSLGNLHQAFVQRFDNYEEYLRQRLTNPDFSAKYRLWSATNTDTIRAAMDAVNLQWDQMDAENSVMATIQRMSQSALGRMQAIQAGNQMAAQTVKQLQKLRELAFLNLQMQSAYKATQTDKESAQKAHAEQFFTAPRGTVIGDEQRYTGF